MNNEAQDEFFSSHNQPIESYLDFFLDQDAPQFAVLLTGPWGCGKTWFIDEYINSRDDGSSILKFSVAGCKNTSELNSCYMSARIKADSNIKGLYEKVENSKLSRLVDRR